MWYHPNVQCSCLRKHVGTVSAIPSATFSRYIHHCFNRRFEHLLAFVFVLWNRFNLMWYVIVCPTRILGFTRVCIITRISRLRGMNHFGVAKCLIFHIGLSIVLRYLRSIKIGFQFSTVMGSGRSRPTRARVGKNKSDGSHHWFSIQRWSSTLQVLHRSSCLFSADAAFIIALP